jgi:predicted patatin/cPLA2 family phospholipase
MRKEYASMDNYFRVGSYLNLDYVYGTLCNSDGENPLDFEAIINNPMRLITVATNAHTGKARYFEKEEMQQDRYDPLKASCAIPVVCKPCYIDGVPYLDGALSDPIPLQKAFECDCDKVVLILTKRKDEQRSVGQDKIIARAIRRRYPIAAKNLLKRAENYNRTVALAKEYEQLGKVLIIAPDDTCGMGTLTRDREKMIRMYHKGYKDAAAIKEFLA